MSIPRLVDGNNQVNVSNSILAYFGVPPLHNTFKPLDELLSRNKDRKICLFLYDGFGKSIQRGLRTQAPFIYDHARFDVSAVYPPTTVAATTAILSGRYPIETGWLGWCQHFKDVQTEDPNRRYIVMFTGGIQGFQDLVVNGPKPIDILPYRSIFSLIDEVKGKGFARSVMAFDCKDEQGNMSAGVFYENVEKQLRDPGCGFVYAYWPEPDHSLHSLGIHSEEVRKAAYLIDQETSEICRRNPDVIFLFIADHGHVPVTWIDIRDFKDLTDTLVEPRFSIEPRFATVSVKPGQEQNFKIAFEKHLSKWFDLYTKEQIYAEHVFGFGVPHKYVDDFIGDFVMVATSDKALYDGYNYNGLKWNHAGAKPEERELLLGVANL